MATTSPLVARLRNFLVGRNVSLTMYNHRLQETQSKRSIPKPKLPDGPSHKLSANSYCLRDGRRISAPPTLVYSTTKQLPEPQAAAEGEKSVAKKAPLLGTPPKWKLSEDEPYLHL